MTAPPRSGQRTASDLAVDDATQNLRTGADQRATRALQIEHERRRINNAQGPVDVERVRGARHAQPLARDELEDITGFDVFLAFAHRVFKPFAGEVAGVF